MLVQYNTVPLSSPKHEAPGRNNIRVNNFSYGMFIRGPIALSSTVHLILIIKLHTETDVVGLRSVIPSESRQRSPLISQRPYQEKAFLHDLPEPREGGNSLMACAFFLPEPSIDRVTENSCPFFYELWPIAVVPRLARPVPNMLATKPEPIAGKGFYVPSRISLSMLDENQALMGGGVHRCSPAPNISTCPV